MTTDERLNYIEDEIQKIKDAMNHNNKVSRDINTKLSQLLSGLQSQIDQIKTQQTSGNVGMGDIFGANPFGVKR